MRIDTRNFSQTMKEWYAAYDDRATEVGKWLGYKALKLKRKYRLFKAAKEEFIRRQIDSHNIATIKSLAFEVSIYTIILTFIVFILVLPTRIEPTNTYHYPKKFHDIPTTPSVYTPAVNTEDSSVENNNEETETVEDPYSFEFESEPVEEVISQDDSYSNEETSNESYNYGLTDWEINMLVQAVQHETNFDPTFYVNGDIDTVQQLMAASIINRIGQPGFGTNYTTPTNLSEVLANSEQYGNILYELNYFDANDARTRQNVMAVLNGEVWVPDDLYFERCSSYGEDYWTAQANFEAMYNNCYTYYTSETWEAKDYYGTGVFIMFGGNPNGAF